MEAMLSPSAELLLVATDPNRGGLLPRRKRRFRKALAVRRACPRARRSPGRARRATASCSC
jgi:hypothetical protein